MFIYRKKGSNFKNKNIRELNLHDMISFFSTDFFKFDLPNRYKIATLLRHMANQTEHNHFSNSKKIFKLFNAIYNGFRDGRFCTIVSRIQDLANKFEISGHFSRDEQENFFNKYRKFFNR